MIEFMVALLYNSYILFKEEWLYEGGSLLLSALK